jgi:hypothetical protein
MKASLKLEKWLIFGLAICGLYRKLMGIGLEDSRVNSYFMS